VGGTVSVMEAMRDVGVRRVVFISSGAVYGHQDQQPILDLPMLCPNLLQNTMLELSVRCGA
jgi:UDP-glucose 4-epimerase